MWLWRGEEQDGPNPYAGMLAWSDYVVVTADSVSRHRDVCPPGSTASHPTSPSPAEVSMASEAAAAGKLVYVASAEECTGRASPPTPPPLHPLARSA